jgi:hypothetical protein
LLTRTKEIEIFKDKQGQWHIRDFGRGLKYQHLTQNENEEKLANPNLVIGKFGVGLKDALATFDRHKARVLVRSRYGDITIVKSEKHGFQGITTLHASIARAYTDRVKTMLLACKKKEVAELLAKDLQGYETGLMHDEMKWNDVAIHACRLLNATEKVIFLTPQQLVETRDMVDHAKSDGLRVVTIPENIREKISGFQDYSGNTIRDLEGFRDEWNKSFEFKFVNPGKLTKEERMVFERTSARYPIDLYLNMFH